ncbi:unnamed protein product [Protopolystoma xenopodis]|uniref:Kinesin-like KIF1-type domain-containing protein n=1 Tax=Protopolystoma xenopodis TaxID=117903 RepID=A0A448WSP1_9PLAT|nr:unnamed protein product [Protopolystoma xenopodis]
MIEMKDLVTGDTWLWERGIFMDRRYLMQEMYQSYVQAGGIIRPSKSDPFFETDETLLVGTAPAFLQALAYRMDIETSLQVTSISGDVVGILNLRLQPCNRSGRLLCDKFGEDIFVEQPMDLLNKPYHFKMELKTLTLFNPAHQRGVKVNYRVFKDVKETCLCLDDLTPPANEASCDTFMLLHTRIVSFPRTQQMQ